MDKDERQARLEQELARFTGYAKTWKIILDVRKLTGWDEAEATSHLVQWMQQGITFDEIIDALKMGEEPQPTFSGIPLES